ncbi:sensor histidine kinase KdpD [Herbaspirillum sp. SJZ107]|uniref:sensor histidine kinase n=1 Tax=Herbaspirillum sp. SJZ107 TaxID=2572881 RepID=UPI001169D7FD|nr:HAMP domain-containing sensor histidine kinase [Herbaspirillum sp. SJZ107]TQK03124.1 signal transduction histidine kinase [Herbaspirillum sp. SJZ107]
MTLATDQNTDGHGLSPTALQLIAIRDAVMDHWEREVRARVDGARDLLRPVLTNTLPAFFDNIAEALSPDHPREQASSGSNAAGVHGGERARMTPFGPDQVVHEYQILRESIALVARGRVALGEREWAIIDESINAATREAIRSFTRSHEELRHKVAAALSHDMRTPLSVVANGAQLLGRTDDWSLVRKIAAKVQSNADRLEDMMAELLDALTLQGAAKIPLHLTRFDILDLARETREQYIPAAGDAVAIDISGEPVVGYWCRASLRRALENLIGNALKYGDRGTVSILAHQTRGRMMLSVHNQGNPIPEEQHDRIFDYLRREAGPLSATGWGIGLPFVKAVGESHGGSVTVDSSPELGTTFLIDIPVDCRPFVEQDGGQLAASRA